ncbi:TniQ family protein [Enterovirga aerilata]|uniref:TniQ domain-containing protein n=1 Tax=Enterovirga aerilata TaxID=2730920 RepID=A0A849I6Q1_9HYPH|nr:TniQ family protein [Enterovirga sp. DB1703]NNM72089.1 hypothetical protein [Enterovirga sp. DB1703]
MAERRKLPARINPTRKTVTPWPGECLPSIAVRYAERTAITVGELLASGLSMRATDLASLPLTRDAVLAMSHLASLDPDDMLLRSYDTSGETVAIGDLGIPAYLLDPARRRVAPGTLKRDGDAPWIRLSWQLRCFACEPTSGEMLVDHCPCGKPISWVRCMSVFRCNWCGADLRDIPVRQAPAHLVESSRTFAALLGFGVSTASSRTIERLFPSASAGARLELFALLGRLQYRTEGAGPPLSCSLAPIRGLELALGWPTSFDGIVAGFVDAQPTRLGPAGALVDLRTEIDAIKQGPIRRTLLRRVEAGVRRAERIRRKKPNRPVRYRKTNHWESQVHAGRAARDASRQEALQPVLDWLQRFRTKPVDQVSRLRLRD